MMFGIVVGAVMVIIMSIIMGIRIGFEENKSNAIIKKLKDTISKKDEDIKNQEQTIFNMHNHMTGLSEESTNLIYDYHIVAELLFDAIGKDEAEKRFTERKNGQPKDVNELIKQVTDIKEKVK